MRSFGVVLLALVSVLAGGRPAARTASVKDLLDGYLSGQFAQVVEALTGDVDYGAILKELERDGPAWIEAQAHPHARGGSWRPRRSRSKRRAPASGTSGS